MNVRQRLFYDYLIPTNFPADFGIDACGDGRIAVALGSEQGGKTHGLVAGMGTWISERPDLTYFAVAPTYPLLQKGVIPKLRDFLGGFSHIGNYNKVEHRIDLKGGGMVYFCSGDEPDESIVGFTAHAGFIDEAGKCSERVFWNSRARLKVFRGPLAMISTPYSQYGWFRDICRDCEIGMQDGKGDRFFIQMTAEDNPLISVEEIREAQRSMPPHEFARRYLGRFAGAQGLVYDNFVHEYGKQGNLVEPFEIPYHWEVYAGLDWGFSNPFVCVWIAREPGSVTWHVVDTTWMQGASDAKCAIAVGLRKGKFNEKWFDRTRAWYYDPSRPDSARLFQEMGFKPVIPGRRGNERIFGINTVYRLIANRHLQVFSDQDHVLRQMSIYHWPEGRDERDKSEVPQDYEHDSLDCIRYVVGSVPEYGGGSRRWDEEGGKLTPDEIENSIRRKYGMPLLEEAQDEDMPVIGVL